VNDILKTTFNSQAELYNEVRPRYSKELFDTLEKETNLSKDTSLLEIGAGTGQATLPLAKRGFAITAVELGSELANIARRELKEYKNVTVITSSFEDVDLPLLSFDLVFCATAFHWIKPEVKFVKTHSLLKEGGHLAIIYTHYVSDKLHDSFFLAAHDIFKKYDGYNATREGKSPVLPTDQVKEISLDNKLFEPVFFKIFPEVLRYSIEDYIKLLSTFSFVIAMETKEREEFLKEIRDLSIYEYEGIVHVSTQMSLTIGRKIN